MRVLDLTTPPMKGGDVRELQQLLANNRFGNFKPGPIDGVFGESTAGAVKRAKYWLGFRKPAWNSPDRRFRAGDVLVAILKGRKLTAAQKLRRKRRLARAGTVPLRVRMLREARRHVGVKEYPPGSNRVLFSNWYGLIGAWCAMYVTYCGVKAGAKASFNPKLARYAYTPFMVRDARLGVAGMSLLTKDQVKEGHVVMFDWQGAGQGQNPYNTDHTGLFIRWTNSEKTEFESIEGNTAVGNDSNGGEVMIRRRSLRHVSAFIQVE